VIVHIEYPGAGTQNLIRSVMRNVFPIKGGIMAQDASAPGQGDRPPKPTEEDLKRLLIEEFYEEFYKESVVRYGRDSDQARTFSRLLMSWRS
jgi:hypothetical protein